MISLSTVGSAGSAAGYFAKDNYYTREQNEAQSAWAGTLAQELGLRGTVDAERFRDLLSGRIGTVDLEAANRRAGFDITFSAPKSVSILAEVFGRAEVRAAHEAAVKTTLERIERDYVRARTTQDGVTVSEPTGRAIFALFRHNTSRAEDPQTHTHAVMANIPKARGRKK